MARSRTRRWRATVAVFLPLVVLGAACAEDDDDEAQPATSSTVADLRGKVVTIFGPEVKQEQQGLEDSFKDFETRTGIDVQVQGSRGFEQQIGVRIDGGDPPDIAMFPQPGKVRDFRDDAINVPADIATTVGENFKPGWTDFVTIDGNLKAVPAKADLKSLVWYSPRAFQQGGYEVPETQEDFTALVDKIIADDKTPFCIGLGSDEATGWPFTDWVEDYMLRLKGPEVYDKWYKHEIPFDDPDVVEVVQYVVDLWSKPGAVLGGVRNVASTPFADAGVPLLDGDCLLHRQGNFYVANWPKGTKVGADGDVNAFYLPTFADKDFGRVTLSGGIYAVAFKDRPEVMETLRFIASTDFANARASQSVGGFLSPNKNTDVSKYQRDIERTFADILAKADPVRFDASDLLPGAVGAGSWWSAAVDITTGKDVKTALTEVEESWPS
jgi:alpha-glucoside transport system substrate-binding protein